MLPQLWAPPPGEAIIGGGVGMVETSLTLASMAASNSKHRPDFQLQAQTAQEDRETKGGVEGEFVFLDILSLYIFWSKAGQRAFQVIF